MFKTIQNDIKEAMLSKNTLKRDCLRAAISEIKNLTVNAGKDITDEICIKVLQKMVKTHNDSIMQFKAANRNDLAEKEIAELKYLEIYLPKKLDANEMKIFVDSIIEQNSIEKSKKNIGQIMKFLSIKKDVLDMASVSKYLKEILV